MPEQHHRRLPRITELMPELIPEDVLLMGKVVRAAATTDLLFDHLDAAVYSPGRLAREVMREQNARDREGIPHIDTVKSTALEVVTSYIHLRIGYSPQALEVLTRDHEYAQRKRAWDRSPSERHLHLRAQVRGIGIVAQLAAGTYRPSSQLLPQEVANRVRSILYS